VSASDKIARLRELRGKAYKGDWIESGDGIIAPDEATIFGAPWIAVNVHISSRPAIIAAINSLDALLNAAEQGDNLIRAINRYVATRAVYLMNLEEDQTQIDARDKLSTALEKSRAALDALSKDTP
jgi:hypothetical protein